MLLFEVGKMRGFKALIGVTNVFSKFYGVKWGVSKFDG